MSPNTAFAVVVAGVLGCSGVEINDPLRLPLPNAKLTILSGGGQTVRRGDSLAAPIVARLDTSGVAAKGLLVEFMIEGVNSPTPNHMWSAVTDDAGIARANGAVTNPGPGPATVRVVYRVCSRWFIKCDDIETVAVAVTHLTVE